MIEKNTKLMKTLRTDKSLLIRDIKVPTGNIFILKTSKGRIECLSVGDYGKEANIKADFLGLKDNPKPIKHQQMIPLEDKWVITVSTQYGCSMGCKFCDVPKVGPGINCSVDDLLDQISFCVNYHNEVICPNRINIHYARMGEPTLNSNVLSCAEIIKKQGLHANKDCVIHQVVSTMMPRRNSILEDYLHRWVSIKNDMFNGDAGLQLSINSTSDEERELMFNSNSLTLSEISKIADSLANPKGRKYTLNFAIAGYEINAKKLRSMFDPRKFIVKLTPMHKTIEAIKNNIKTQGDYTSMYPYEHIEEELKSEGFDVLVFLASEAEDLGRITCGNAILSGSEPLY